MKKPNTHLLMLPEKMFTFVSRWLPTRLHDVPRWLGVALILCFLSAPSWSQVYPIAPLPEECPTHVPVTFKGRAKSADSWRISLNGNTAQGLGDPSGECGLVFESNQNRVYLKPDKQYDLRVSAVNVSSPGGIVCAYALNLSVPEDYKLEINGVERYQVAAGHFSPDNACVCTVWKVVVRRKCDCEPEGSHMGSVHWAMNMGRLADGDNAENISIREENITAAVYTPAALNYSPPESAQVDVVRDVNDVLRQVYAPENLADIVTLNAYEYEIRLYKPADVGPKTNGLYPVSGTPMIVWKIRNPNPPAIGRLQIIRTQGAMVETSEYSQDVLNDTWTLTQGGPNGARIETMASSYPTLYSRAVTRVVRDGNGALASKKVRVYQTFPWGVEVVSEIDDPDGAALTTTYTYYEDPQAAQQYSKLQSVTNADGSWVKYDYDGNFNITQELHSWKDVTLATANVTNCRATLYTYESNGAEFGSSSYNRYLKRTDELIEGKIVRSTQNNAWNSVNGTPTQLNGQPVWYEARTESNIVTSSTTAPSLVSETTTQARYQVTAALPYAERLALTDYPDGRRDTYQYEKGDWTPHATDPALSVFTPNPAGLAERDIVTHGTTTQPNGIAFKTTRDVTVRDQCGRTVMTESYVYDGATYERLSWTASKFDSRSRLIETRKHNGQVTTAVYDGDMKVSETNENGEETTYSYDSMMRVKTQTRKGVAANGSFPAQPDLVTTFNYDAEGRVISQTVTGGALSLTNATVYDVVGRVIRSTDQTGLATATEYATGGRTTVRLPGGAVQITDQFLDGRSKSVTGTAVVAQTFDYGLENTALTVQVGTNTYPVAYEWTMVYTGPNGVASPRWSKTFSDWQGHQIKTERPGFTGVNLAQWATYNNKGQLVLEETKAGAVRMARDKRYEYDALGQPVRSGADNDNDGALTPASLDQITDTETVYEKVGSDWFSTTTVKSYLTDNNATPTTLQTQKERLNNFPSSGSEKTVSESVSMDVNGNQSKFTTLVDRAAKKVRTVTDVADSTQDAISITVNGWLQSSTPATPRNATTYGYDALGRQITVTDPATGTTTNVYDAATGRLISTAGGGQMTTYAYYPANHANAGRALSQANTANKKVYFDYSVRGELSRTWGDTTYPLEYVYNSFGEKTELRTYRSGNGWAGAVWPGALAGAADATTWIFDGATGLLTTKRDAANKDTVYSYDAAGRLLTRTWVRTTAGNAPIVTTYAYQGNALELSGINYSDGTPNVTFSYDRNGRQKSVTDAAGTRARTFNAVGATLNETFTAGMLNGIQISNGYDTLLRRQSLGATMNATSLVSQTYGYDVYGRMGTITSGAQTVTYGYYPTTGLLNTTSYTGGTNLARVYDSFGRLQTITTTPAAGGAISYTYHYDSLNRRDKVTREDGSYWSYGYNDRGELTFGKKFFADNTPVAGMQFEYGYDNLGNRQATKAGGNDLGTGLRNASYTANNLNQYTQRTVPGVFDVTGEAAAGATVTVNGQGTYRKNSYFQKELTVSNAAGPVYQQVNVVGAKNNAGAAGEDAVAGQSGKVYVPQATEAYAYDFDGNLTQDGRWVYTWDAENRLTSMTAIAAAPVTAKRKLEFAYDYMGRRIEKKVYDWNVGTSAYVLTTTTRFVYDGWNLITEGDASLAVKKTYVWGLDIGNQEEDAGGIGGLLCLVENGEIFSSGFDGISSVTSLIKSSNGKVSAIYEYNAYGREVAAVSESANKNPFRFSTKYTDEESNLLYFGYRYYNPVDGRFLSRDSLEEEGGENLYAYCLNSPANAYDPLGQVANWHHLLPQAFEKEFKRAGIKDIGDPFFGWILDADFHTGKGGLHSLGWNRDWERFFARHKRERTRPNRDAILRQLRKMMDEPNYKEVLLKLTVLENEASFLRFVTC